MRYLWTLVALLLFLPGTEAPGTEPLAPYGASVADLKNARFLRELGFPWMKGYLSWARIEAQPGQYDWTDLDKGMREAQRLGLRLLLRVDSAPSWAHPSNPDPTAPPDPPFLPTWGRFLEETARRAKGEVVAYEIWNEPNLDWQWGGRPPDPAAYGELLRVAYRHIKAGDAAALVVAAGLAPTQGDGGHRSWDNLAYLDALYALGTGPFFDVLGSHPYGFAAPPEADPLTQAAFRMAERERAIMVRWGDTDKKMWATEFGWLVDPGVEGLTSCKELPSWALSNWFIVDEATQATYLTRAYRYAGEHWPWMGPMFLFNLDFSLAPWYEDPCEPMRFHALFRGDGAPRPAFDALKVLAHTRKP